MKKICTLALSLLAFSPLLRAQEAPAPAVTETFSGNRTINLQTVETMKKKTLGYRIVHRFSELETGPYGGFGMDGPATIGIQFDYGISDRITVGLGKMTWNKMTQAYGKFKILSQSGSMPVTLTGFARVGINNMKTEDLFGTGRDSVFTPFTNRMTFVTSLMVARKFGERFSVQVQPMLIHYNLDYGTYLFSEHSNDIFAVAAQLSWKFNKRLALNLEYTHAFGNYVAELERPNYHDNLGLGLDIKTGGHVFQIVLINTFAIDEEFAVPFNFTDMFDWNKNDGIAGGLRLGFNIQRDFHL